MSDASLSLPDGRTLAYREYGDPLGAPIVNNHGGLVCGLDISPADRAARDLGLRIISPDRPGVGRSTLLEGRRTADWPADVAVLLGHLGYKECAAFGWSLGSEYALALGAAGLATRVVVVGGVPPMSAGHLDELNRTDRVLARLSERRPAAARKVFAGMRRRSSTVKRLTARTSGPADNHIVAGLTGFDEWMHHGLLQSQGAVEEYRAMCRPWGFSPNNVSCPVTVWQGAQDEFVPPSLARELADALPNADYRELDGAGHFLAYERWREVLSPLA